MNEKENRMSKLMNRLEIWVLRRVEGALEPVLSI